MSLRPPAARRHQARSSDANAALFADPDRAAAFPAVLSKVRALDEMRRTVTLYRTHSEPRAGAEMLAQLRAIFAE